MADHCVALQVMHHHGGEKGAEARKRLTDALGGGRVDEPDDTGIVEVHVEADDFEAAVTKVWNALAAAGADDHLAFAEHVDVPEHWRYKDGSSGMGSLA